VGVDRLPRVRDLALTVCVVDLHNHMVTEAVVDFLAREGHRLDTRIEGEGETRLARIGASAVRPLHARMCDAPARIADMDRLGIRIQAVSCTPFVLYPDAPPDLGLALARVNNDSLAELARAHPDRFAPLASVPLSDPEAAADELERAVGLGLRGVEIPPATAELDLDDPRLDPFFAAAASARVPLCIHPFDASPAGALARYGLSPLVGNPMDTGLAASLLVMGGVLERHPGLRIVLYHGGGTFPALLGRIAKGHALFPVCRTHAPRPPHEYLHHFSFDTVVFEASWLRYLIDRFGADRVVLGTDYPLPLGPRDPVGELRATGLGEEVLRRILGANALALLGVAATGEAAA
jgi:aminocarboxymuconate-semialdehyde decarboxylase